VERVRGEPRVCESKDPTGQNQAGWGTHLKMDGYWEPPGGSPGRYEDDRGYTRKMRLQRISRAIGVATCLVCIVLCAHPVLLHAAPATPAGTTRTYYVAAEEVQWNYVPSGRDEAMGMEFDEVGRAFTESGPHRIGRVYKKAIYRDYTDATFSTLKKAVLKSNI